MGFDVSAVIDNSNVAEYQTVLDNHGSKKSATQALPKKTYVQGIERGQ